MEMTNCDKCTHGKEHHVNGICEGERFCLCIKFEETPEVLKNVPQLETIEPLRSRTDVPLPMFITTHDNWRGWGWQYKKKYGKTQSQMVEFLYLKCKLTQHEIRVFLRCKESSVRGRLSELRKKQTLQMNYH